ncbi:MAG: rhomboid family intramembrane serine protease [Verrucomicrobiales bacterium]
MNSPSTLLPSDHRREHFVDAVRDNVMLLFGAVGIAWALEILDFFLLGSLDSFGIKPRTLSGLPGIGTMSFLHGGFGHLLSNTLPFLMLGGIVLMGGRKVFFTATLMIITIGGGALWTLGPGQTNHIGASLLIFGYLGFLIARGFVEKSGLWIAVSILVLVLYGGMIAGVLPGREDVSWQGHLFGFGAGIIAARVMFTRSIEPGAPLR